MYDTWLQPRIGSACYEADVTQPLFDPPRGPLPG